MRGVVALAALALALLASAPFAVAGPPIHQPLPTFGLTGGLTDPGALHPAQPFNHACGTAVDSQGDVYVASAGNGSIDIFKPNHEYLTSISNANEPCALAVDSKGNLYVSETKAGEVKVVKYSPSVPYPFTGTPAYNAPTTIDANPNAKGIAVDPVDDRLYVAEGTRIATYNAGGALGENEAQVIQIRDEGGTFTLSFEAGAPCAPVPTSASLAQIEACLGEILGVGNFSVEDRPPTFYNEFLVTFTGALGSEDVPLLTADKSAMLGHKDLPITELVKGFDGHIAEGELSGATGVAAYTYSGGSTRYVFAAEPSGDEIQVLAGSNVRTLELRTPINGSVADAFKGDETPAGELGLASGGAYLSVDPGNVDPVTNKCASVAQQACTAGHIFAYDATHEVVNEFEATGQYFTQTEDPAFEDAEPTAVAVDRSGGANDGTVYVTAGAGAGAQLLAFGPVAAPSRASLDKPLSREFPNACGSVVDSAGNIYVAGDAVIRIFSPAGVELTHIEAGAGRPCDLAVDSEGDLYAFERIAGSGGEQIIAHYQSEGRVFPPESGTKYVKLPPVETISPGEGELKAIAVNPANDHLFATHSIRNIIEFESAANNNILLRERFCSQSFSQIIGIDVYGAESTVYFFESDHVTVCDAAGNVLARIDGSGSPAGEFGTLFSIKLAVDQSNGNVLVSTELARKAVEEYEPSGAFVGELGSFQQARNGLAPNDIAVDNSGGPNEGNLYVAYDADNNAIQPYDLTALGPLNYGEPPIAFTGIASGLGAGNATLNGTVDPRSFEVTECKFEYLLDSEYEANLEAEEPAFEGAATASCDETSAEIGQGKEPVAVKAALTGLESETRYRFRLIAENRYGVCEKCRQEAGLFGPPVIADKSAQPVLYREATLRANLDSSGLQTQYHFEYLTDGEYQENLAKGKPAFAGAQSTSTQTLPASSSGAVDVEAFLTGLAEGTSYRFRPLAENEAAAVTGADRVFTTLEKLAPLPCPNETLRLENNSAGLPDCRAYELVTPADTRGATPGAAMFSAFDNWLVTPTGPLAGKSLAFFTSAGLPGFDGSGFLNAFRATRGDAGWSSQIFSPTYTQAGGKANTQNGVSADQLYSFWAFGTDTPGAFPPGRYLRTPPGSPQPSANCAVEAEPQGRYEWIGCGSLGIDPSALGGYVSPSGAHVIFTTENASNVDAVQLEPEAPPAPTGAVYDRSPGGETHVVSLLPGNVTPSGEASFEGVTPDGSAVVFSVAGKLYLRRDNSQTVEVAPAGAFAGISDDGERVFYENGGGAYVCDLEAGPCVGGSEPPGLTEIAASAKFVNVSAEGRRAYFTSELQLGGEPGPAIAQPNLYVWDTAGIRFVAVLGPGDLQDGEENFPGTGSGEQIALDSWTAWCAVGRAYCPSRTSPDGGYLAFQSHADLTPPYEGQGHSTIYRYDADDGSLLCVSCDPSGAPASGDADFQSFSGLLPAKAETLIPGVTEDGSRIFFQAASALLPEDANSVLDVYEWLAPGAGGCEQAKGCLALISSGQSDNPNYIYSMTPDGHDVFFSTVEKLISSDIVGSSSIYDARVEGGFPQPVEREPCHGDACQGEGSAAPSGAAVRSDVPNSGNAPGRPNPRCRKGERRVRRAGKTRCVKRHAKHRRKRQHRKPKHSRTNAHERGQR